jgi:uncharacterized membrane protein (DUF4010 family)
MDTSLPLVRLLLAVALGFFLGVAYEEFHARSHQKRPGGIRSFPLIALTGALLYRLDPAHLVPLCVGLAALSGWLAIYYGKHVTETDPDGFPNVGLMVPICNVLAFLLGPVALSEPPWVAIGTTVACVLFLTARETLHGFAQRIEVSEIVNAGRFLLLTGFILPVLPNTPVTTLTTITPYQVWLAVVAVCSVSYASYLLRRYVAPASAGLLTAVLGGLYSSTATTVVLARRAGAEAAASRQTRTGIILATCIMYLRLLAVIAFFNPSLALEAAPRMIGLSLAGFVFAAGVYWFGPGARVQGPMAAEPSNPLELTAAAVFAALFIIVSAASTWAVARFGTAGIYALAAIVGVSDIDPFVLSLAQNGSGAVTSGASVAAILIAASSNNLLKAVYVVVYSGGRMLVGPMGALLALAAAGIVLALGWGPA